MSRYRMTKKFHIFTFMAHMAILWPYMGHAYHDFGYVPYKLCLLSTFWYWSMPTYWVHIDPSLETIAVTLWEIGASKKRHKLPKCQFFMFLRVFDCVTNTMCPFKYLLILEHANILSQHRPKSWNHSCYHMGARGS